MFFQHTYLELNGTCGSYWILVCDSARTERIKANKS